MKDFINFESMHECIKNIYTEALDEEDANKYEDIIDEMSYYTAQGIANDMKKYVHMDDTHIDGNFNNIKYDWEYHKQSFWVAKGDGEIAWEVKPFGTFADMVKGMDEDTLTDEQVGIVQEWCEGWFFDTFGTYGIEYNFQNIISEIEYEDEREAERA